MILELVTSLDAQLLSYKQQVGAQLCFGTCVSVSWCFEVVALKRLSHVSSFLFPVIFPKMMLRRAAALLFFF